VTEKIADKPEILIVDDSKVIRRAAAKMLGSDYIVSEAVDGLDGWQQLQENLAISVVFTDIMMPEMDGIELLANIRESNDERIANLPVIMITGHSDNETIKKKVFNLGATDFITKPFDSVNLISRAKSYASLSRKIVELEEKTGYDKLTGLYNATNFEEQGAKTLSFASRHKLNISIISMEIDDFQNLFLSYGKAVAQQIIIAVGKRLQETMRTEDIAARTGVARYVLLLPLTNENDARIIVNRIRETISNLVFDTGKERLRVVLAAGIYTYEIDEEIEFAELMSRTDVLLKEALGETGEKISVHKISSEVSHVQSAISEDDIQRALMLILRGDIYKISDDHLEAVMERLSPFLEYAESRMKDKRVGSGSSS